jgi:hypothetical protein
MNVLNFHPNVVVTRHRVEAGPRCLKALLCCAGGDIAMCDLAVESKSRVASFVPPSLPAGDAVGL